MNWFIVYFFVSAQIYPLASLDPERFIQEHARQTCISYNGAFFDQVVESERSGKKYERLGYRYTARCYFYDFTQPAR